MVNGGIITLVPEVSLKLMKDFIKGLDKEDLREGGSCVKSVIDSSGWIEFFTGGRLADRYASYMKDPSPSICYRFRSLTAGI